MKKLISVVSALVLIGGFALYSHGDSPVFEGIRGPLASGEEEGYAPLDGPLSDKIEAGKVLPEVVFMPGTKKLRDLPNDIATKKIAMREMLAPEPAAQSTTSGPIQTAITPSKTPTVGAGFEGISLNNGGGGWPPDTNGDIGPLNYVQTVNTSVKMIDRGANPRPSKQFTFNEFMKGAGQPSSAPCGSQNSGDPVVQYDTTANRWVVLDFAFNNKYVPSYFCVAVSDTNDAFGTWKSAQLLASSTELADYPKMASTPQGFVISANMFKGGRSYSGANVWVLDRNSLFATTPSLKSILYKLGTSYFSLMPVNVRFPTVGGISANSGYLLSDYGLSGSMRIFQFTPPNFASGATNTIKQTTILVGSYSSFSSRVPQFGSTETVDALGDRLMYSAEFDDATKSMYVSRTVTGTKSFAGIRWYQIPVTASTPSAATSTFGTTISSTFSPDDATHRWMPSLAVNNNKELAIAYSSSAPSKSTYPGIFAVGRSASSLNSGTLDFGEVVLKSGSGSQSGGYSRRGDYSRVSVDPVDKCTFWYTTEYYSAIGNNWNTWITPFKLDPATCP